MKQILKYAEIQALNGSEKRSDQTLLRHISRPGALLQAESQKSVKKKPPFPFSHVVGLLCIPLPSPLSCGIAMACQSLLINLLSLLLPAQVLRSLPTGHGHGHVHRALWAWPSTLQRGWGQKLIMSHRKRQKTKKKKVSRLKLLTVHSLSSSVPVFTLSKSRPPQFRTCLLLPSLRSMSGAGPERLGSSRKLRIGLSPSCC